MTISTQRSEIIADPRGGTVLGTEEILKLSPEPRLRNDPSPAPFVDCPATRLHVNATSNRSEKQTLQQFQKILVFTRRRNSYRKRDGGKYQRASIKLAWRDGDQDNGFLKTLETRNCIGYQRDLYCLSRWPFTGPFDIPMIPERRYVIGHSARPLTVSLLAAAVTSHLSFRSLFVHKRTTTTVALSWRGSSRNVTHVTWCGVMANDWR
jgi:hypothetical protein